MAHINSEMRACIEACGSCHDVCIETLTHCLTMGGRHAEAGHIGTLLDCAQICETSADFMLRGSALHAEVCDACADVCDACAESCATLEGAEMKRCADECRRCAEQCRAMAGMTA
jgi:hypothetical protein